MTMSCMDFFLQTQAICPKLAGQQEGPKNRKNHFDTASATGTDRILFTASFLVIGSTFDGINGHVEAKKWLFCLGLSSRLSFEGVRVTQGLLCTPPGVVLDKTPKTSKRKFAIGRLTLSILNPSSLMLTELLKSLTSIDSFKKGVSL